LVEEVPPSRRALRRDRSAVALSASPRPVGFRASAAGRTAWFHPAAP